MLLILVFLSLICTALSTYNDRRYIDNHLNDFHHIPFRSHSAERGFRRQRDYDYPYDPYLDHNDLKYNRVNDYDAGFGGYRSRPQVHDHLRQRYRKNNEYYTPPKYSFGYGITDPYHGTNFGHRENRDRGHTDGEYYVDLPDGRLQKVSYVADKNGYRPIVEYIGKAHYPSGKRNYGRKYY